MKRKRGFTLTELLAVIVVIAIISLIAVPVVFGLIEKSRKEAFKESVILASKSVDYYLYDNHMEKLSPDGVEVDKLDIISNFTAGTFKEKNNEYFSWYVTDGNYCAYGPISDLKISKNCDKMDESGPELDSSKLNITATSNGLSINILRGFAIDFESGIKSYTITVYDEDGNEVKETPKTFDNVNTSKNYSFTLNNLKTGSYRIKIEATNYNNLSSNFSIDKELLLIEKPICSIIPTGWSSSKTVKCTYPKGYTNEYSLDNGLTWNVYEKEIPFNNYGTLIARTSDGVNYQSSSSYTVTGIDRTAPETVKLTYSTTPNSITVTASAIDQESGIYGYQFSKDGGNTWTDIQTSSNYIFKSLKAGDYNIRVNAVNGTYINDGLNSTNTTSSEITKVAIKDVEKPKCSIKPNGYAQSKNISCTFYENLTHEYSLDDGLTWIKYSGDILVEKNQNVFVKVSSDSGYVDSVSLTVNGIDRTAPNYSSLTCSTTSNSIHLQSVFSDSESGIYGYKFSIDNGKTYSNEWSNDSSYTISSLKTGTYNVKVKAINNTFSNNGENNMNTAISPSISCTTKGICTPKYNVIPGDSLWSQSKKVEIYTDSGCSGIIQYSLDGENWNNYTAPITITKNNSFIIARVTDGTNYVTASSKTITTIDTTAPESINFTHEETSSSIKIISSATDNQSGIEGYLFSKDGGNTWTDIQTSNIYTFNKLISGTYNIKVKAINKTYSSNGMNVNNTIESEIQSVETVKPSKTTCSIVPSGWATSKTISIAYPSGYTNEYSIDGGSTWNKYSGAITANKNNFSVITRTYDGFNYFDGVSCTAVQVDTTSPESTSFTYTATTNSIKVVATGKDSESGIYGYQFSKDDGSTWTSIQTSNTYTFNSLKTGSYKIKVRAYNGTYSNGGRLYKDSSSVSIKTTDLTLPTFERKYSNGYTASDTITIKYPSGYTNQYSIDMGKTWLNYTKAIEVNSNISIIARIYDGTNYSGSNSLTITNIDTTSPESTSFTHIATTNSIKVVATGKDSESGIYGYQFSKDDGSTWTSIQTSNTYTFNSLKTGSYKIKVRAYNGTYSNGGRLYKDSLSNSISLNTLPNIKYTIDKSGWATSKTVTIGCTNSNDCSSYNIEYSLDGGSTWNSYSSPIKFTANGIIIARISDGTNYLNGASQSITGIDTTTPNAPELSGGSTSWSSSSRTISVSTEPTNSPSGINYYEYYVSTSSSTQTGGSWVKLNSKVKSVTLTTEGTHYVFMRAVSNSGVVGNISVSATIKIDTKTPTECTISGGNATEWSNTSRTISISKESTAVSGIAYYEYYASTSNTTQTGGSWQKMTGKNVIFKSNGTKYIFARAVSGSGIVKQCNNYETVKIDASALAAPTLSGGSDSWKSYPVSVGVSGEPASVSGIAYYEYYISTSNTTQTGGSWVKLGTNVKSTTISTNGTYYVYMRAVNNAGVTGNISAAKKVMVDLTTPTVSITAKKVTAGTAVSSGSWSSEGLNFVLTKGTTDVSGYTIYYCQDTTNTCTPKETVASGTNITSYNTTTGKYYVRYLIKSGAGKASTTGSYAAQIDNVAPTGTLRVISYACGNATTFDNCYSGSGKKTSGTWTNSKVTFKFNSGDIGSSGLSSISYCIGTAANSCSSWTTYQNGEELNSSSITKSGNYYINFKITSKAGKSSFYNFNYKYDKDKPSFGTVSTKSTTMKVQKDACTTYSSVPSSASTIFSYNISDSGGSGVKKNSSNAPYITFGYYKVKSGKVLHSDYPKSGNYGSLTQSTTYGGMGRLQMCIYDNAGNSTCIDRYICNCLTTAASTSTWSCVNVSN